MKKIIFTDLEEDYRFLESSIYKNANTPYIMITIEKDSDVDGLIEFDIQTAKDFIEHLSNQIKMIEDGKF